MKKIICATFFCSLFWGHAQRDWSKVEITSEKISDHIHIIYGAGGNIGLAIGQENAYLIDAQFSPLTGKILSHIKTITDKPVSFLLNTHWHGDHTGGNANMAQQGALVIAHDNVRKRMHDKQLKDSKTDLLASLGLPTVTFNDKMTLHLSNGNSMHALSVGPAHTDGDAYYYFPEENVLHMGDNFFAGRYPYIDLNSGGDIDGLISNVTMALALVDEQTKIIPGHGKLADKKELQAYKAVLVSLRQKVVQAREKGKTLEETQQMGLSKQWDATHGQGFINANKIVEFIYKSAN